MTSRGASRASDIDQEEHHLGRTDHAPASEDAAVVSPLSSLSDSDIATPSAAKVNDTGHGGHKLMMMICCVPMVIIAILLVATGVAGPGFIVTALLCTAMMAAMMFTMPGSHDHK